MKFSRRLRTITTFIAIAAGFSQSAKILLLGDSITKGGPTPQGVIFKPWRAWLKEIADQNLAGFEFVGLKDGWIDPSQHWSHSNTGTCSTPRAYLYPAHGAECGQTSEFVNLWLEASLPELRQTPPDVVVIASGTNNLGVLKQTPDQAISETRKLALTILQNFPKTNLLVAQLLPRTDNYSDLVPEYNRRLPALIFELQAKGARVSILDWNQSIDPTTDLIDGLHPTDLGANKLAKKAYALIEPSVSTGERCPNQAGLETVYISGGSGALTVGLRNTPDGGLRYSFLSTLSPEWMYFDVGNSVLTRQLAETLTTATQTKMDFAVSRCSTADPIIGAKKVYRMTLAK
ncbi:MAG: hypothetical protein IPK50_00845 [Fibrobacterota bacterium]|nr:MAG: hypothetical protein IPK50_00845 [Fibrobacterota bacterium]